MDRTITYGIEKEYNGVSILEFLKNNGYTHHVIVRLKQTENGIIKNGKWAHIKDLLQENDSLTIRLCEPEFTTTILPTPLSISVVYEDEDILVVDKPAHMPVHPSINHYEHTLANAVCFYGGQKGEIYPFRCMNRLDRDTTGLTIIAKNMLSAGILSEQVKNRTLHRTYLAICQGLVPMSGTVDAPIVRKEASTVERCIDYANGETAITHFSRIGYDAQKDLSLVELVLETGRTHQIRVHMKHLGHPLIGDFLYNPDFTYIDRQALHSCRLDFIHPITKKEMHLASPLPMDLKRISSFI